MDEVVGIGGGGNYKPKITSMEGWICSGRNNKMQDEGYSYIDSAGIAYICCWPIWVHQELNSGITSS